jgi:hypothetical protein
MTGDPKRGSEADAGMDPSSDILSGAVDRIFDTAAAQGAFFVAPDQKRGERNAPSPALFDLVLWNVVIAFFVNLLASAAFERVQQWKRRKEEQGERPFTADQIALLREEIRRELDGLPTPQRHALVLPDSTGPLEPLLYSFGLPRSEARALAAEVDRELGAVVREWAGGRRG